MGVDFCGWQLCLVMSRQDERPQQPDPLDELAASLLECGAPLSQMIAHMVRFQPGGRPPPDLAPIPDVARSMIRDVLDEVGTRYSERDIRVAAEIVLAATNEICENIFFVGPELN